MSTHPPPFNPSQAVERIREIIVGRHLERLEERIERLEVPNWLSPAAASADDRQIATDARLEALHQNLQATREAVERQAFLQREEIQRLAAQIQQVAAARTEVPAAPAVDPIERKLGLWLAAWQQANQEQTREREYQIAAHLQRELDSIREWVETRFAELDRRYPDRASIDERFNRIAAAARALAQSASPFSPGRETTFGQ